jgi:hypothetical protein
MKLNNKTLSLLLFFASIACAKIINTADKIQKQNIRKEEQYIPESMKPVYNMFNNMIGYTFKYRNESILIPSGDKKDPFQRLPVYNADTKKVTIFKIVLVDHYEETSRFVTHLGYFSIDDSDINNFNEVEQATAIVNLLNDNKYRDTIESAIQKPLGNKSNAFEDHIDALLALISVKNQ